MKIKMEINPKTGKPRYKARYYFFADGKKKDSETSWFDTEKQAEKEAERLKAEKERADELKVLHRRDMQLYNVFSLYIDYLDEIRKEEKSTGDKTLWATACAIKNKHMPSSIMRITMAKIDALTFKSWINSINNNKEIGGQYVRKCKQVLLKFNYWLGVNGYIEELKEEEIDNSIRRVQLKSKSFKNREDEGSRVILSITDIDRIGRYYIKKGIEVFDNFYYYTLFYVLFLSGMRVEELAGLQWKFIDLRESERKIYIKNAISEKESIEHALKRVENMQYKTKSKTSTRIIPIFDYYYDLLIDYKECYKYEFGLSDSQVEEGFVFPRLSRRDSGVFLSNKTLLKELRKTLNELGMKKTDLQMFRHSCATFLILPSPNGLGYDKEQVVYYFGHQDSTMLERVYTRLSALQKNEKLKNVFSDIYKPADNEELTKEEENKLRMISKIKGDSKDKKKARMLRIFKQIERAEKTGKDIYYYQEKDKRIIERYRTEYNPLTKLKFKKG